MKEATRQTISVDAQSIGTVLLRMYDGIDLFNSLINKLKEEVVELCYLVHPELEAFQGMPFCEQPMRKIGVIKHKNKAKAKGSNGSSKGRQKASNKRAKPKIHSVEHKGNQRKHKKADGKRRTNSTAISR